MSVYTLSDFLSPAECEAAIALFPPPRPATVYGNEGIVEQLAIRVGRASFLVADTDEKRALVERMHRALLRANEVAFHYEIDGTEALQLAEYSEGCHFGWHVDLGPGASAHRKLSATVQLSNPDDYDGGDLQVWAAPPCPRVQGSVTVFSAHALHRVTPITRGVRKAVIAWAMGNRPFR